jgi:hypothetical protein
MKTVGDGTLNVASGKKNYLKTLNVDAATVVITVEHGNTKVGKKELPVTKARRGEDTITCYIESSMGNLFE